MIAHRPAPVDPRSLWDCLRVAALAWAARLESGGGLICWAAPPGPALGD